MYSASTSRSLLEFLKFLHKQACSVRIVGHINPYFEGMSGVCHLLETALKTQAIQRAMHGSQRHEQGQELKGLHNRSSVHQIERWQGQTVPMQRAPGLVLPPPLPIPFMLDESEVDPLQPQMGTCTTGLFDH